MSSCKMGACSDGGCGAPPQNIHMEAVNRNTSHTPHHKGKSPSLGEDETTFNQLNDGRTMDIDNIEATGDCDADMCGTMVPNGGMGGGEEPFSTVTGLPVSTAPVRGSVSMRLAITRSTALLEAFAEFVGTYIIVFFGTGVVAAAVLTGSQQGLWQVAVVWGWAVSLAIYSTAHISGAHLNPAVSLAFAIFRPKSFTWRKFGIYVVAQLLGAVAASATVYGLFYGSFKHYESKNNLIRGEMDSIKTAMCFGEYFPNPGAYSPWVENWDVVGVGAGFGVEMFGTAFLMFTIMSLTDKCNNAIDPKFVPLMIGFTVSILISVTAPLTQAGLNPARDFGPRIVAYFAGWGKMAIPGPRNDFWVYILAPFVGAPLGALMNSVLLQRCKEDEECYRLKSE